ncbi:unnamed protein product [Closterium sp. Naga37s-1]|nr:unnamed protein product [Closterium sp. Naga37s-1]
MVVGLLAGPGSKPAGPGSKPAGPGSKPAGPGSKPAGPGSKPAGPGSKPAGPGSKPAGPGIKPAGPGIKPAGPGIKPAGPGIKPAGPGIKPAGPGIKPAGPGIKPAGPGIKPAGPDIQSAAVAAVLPATVVPDHPGETTPLPPTPGTPPPEPELQVATKPDLQATADTDVLLRRREYLIRKADYDAAAENYAQAVAGRDAHLGIVTKDNENMATYTPTLIAWSAVDNRACTVLLGALPDTLMRRFQARELRASVIWAELHAMFERRDISSVGIPFQEYFCVMLATYDGAVDYVEQMREVADRLDARQAGLSEPLKIHRLLFNLTPDYESRLHAFTEANPMADLGSVEQWIIETEVKLRTSIVNLATPQPSSSSLNATQSRKQGNCNGKGGGGSKSGGGRGEGSGGGSS